MLEGLVAWVLNNYLGKYVENLNTDQLSIAMLSGKVELENLPLKKDALRHLGLPIEVKAGFLGKVQLQVPVRQIRTAPWVIVIERLYLVAAPVNLNEWDPEIEVAIAHERKIAILDALEAQWRAENEAHLDSSYYATSYSSWLSYGTGLLGNIAENLQLKLNDVHIRYEDNLTCSTSFACGLTVESLSAESCDSSWQKGFTNYSNGDLETCSFKLVELQKLAVYWDPITMPGGMLTNYTLAELTTRMSQNWAWSHNYILSPSNAIAYLKRERSEQPLRSRNRPRITCNLTLDQVVLNLNNNQYDESVGCVRGLNVISRLRTFRERRPSVGVQQDARAWWIYAVKCHFPDACWMAKTPTWGECLERARAFKEYVEICLWTLTNPAATLPLDKKEIKDKFELNTPLEILKPLREAAMRRVPKAPKLATTPVQDSNEAGRSMLVQWFPQWWGWYGNNDSQNPTTPSDHSENSNLEEEILDVLADSIENNTILKRDTVFGHFDFTVSKGSLNLSVVDTDSVNDRSMLELQFEKVCLSVQSRPRTSSHMVSMTLGTVVLKDKITKDTLFPVLIAPQGTIRESLCGMNPTASMLTRYQSRQNAASPPPQTFPSSDEPLFNLIYEKKPFNSNCDYKLYVKSQPLEIVYNSGSVKWLSEFISHPLNAADGHGVAVKAAGAYMRVRDSTKAHIMNQWEHIMKGHAAERSAWNIELDVSAPQIMFVEDFTDKNGTVIVVDFGKMQLNNIHSASKNGEPQDREPSTENDDEEMFMTPCSTPPGSIISPSSPKANMGSIDTQDLHDLIYDSYKIELSDLQILVGKARDNWKYAHNKGTSSLHLLDRFSISLLAERRKVQTNDPQYPSAVLLATLPSLTVHLSEHKVAAVRSLLSDLVATTPTTEPQGLQENRETHNDESEADTTETDRSSSNISKLFLMRFKIDQLSLEVQSRGRCIAEVQVCGVVANFTRRPLDYSLTLSVLSLLLVDALQSYGSDFELLVASHKHVGMDVTSGSIRDSEPTSPTSPASPATSLQPNSLAANTLASALLQLHAPNMQQSFGDRALSPVLGLDSEALIVVEVTVVSTPGEEMRIANIAFNNLDIIANQETIVELIGFTQRIISPKGVPKRIPTETNLMKEESVSTASLLSLSHPQDEYECEIRTDITFDFHRLSILLLRADVVDGVVVAKKIGTATMSGAKIQATIGGDLITARGSLGGLTGVSLCPGSIHTRVLSVGRDALQDTTGTTYHQVVNDGTPALDFQVTRSTKDNDVLVSAKIHVASVWYTHSGALLGELASCVGEFRQYLANLAKSIRAAAADMAIGLVHPRGDMANNTVGRGDLGSSFRRGRSGSYYPSSWLAASHGSLGPAASLDNDSIADYLKLENIVLSIDIQLETPVVVLPRSTGSTEVFVAHLGNIYLTNIDNSNYKYQLQVRDISLYSLDIVERLKDYKMTSNNMRAIYSCESQGKPVLHNTTLHLDIEYDDFEPNTMINGKIVTPLRVSATREQYEQLLETLKGLPIIPVQKVQDSNDLKGDDVTDDSGITTLRMDPHIRARVLTASTTAREDFERFVLFKVNFQLPSFTVELRADFGSGERSMVDLSFRDFNVNYDKCNRHETNIQVSLHSITMEDLTKDVDSKHRLMMVSHTPQTPKAVYLSKSCPDFLTEFPIDDVSSISSMLQYKHRRSSLPHFLNVCDGVFNHKERKCGATPPPSPRGDEEEVKSNATNEGDNLVLISVKIVDSEHPEFESKFNKVSKKTKIDFNCLNLVVNVDSWVAVLDFFGVSSDSDHNEHKVESDSASQHQEVTSTDPSTECTSEVETNIRRLTAVLVGRGGVEVCRAAVCGGRIFTRATAHARTLTARLPALALHTTTAPPWRHRLMTAAHTAVGFTYRRLNPEEALTAGYDSTLEIEMSSIRYVHTKRFVAEIQAFFRDFSLLQNVLAEARKKVSVAPPGSRANRMRLRIDCLSPVIVVPVSSTSSSALVLDMERLTVENCFKNAGDPGTVTTYNSENSTPELLDVRTIRCENTKLYCGERREDGTDGVKLEGRARVVKCGPSLLTRHCLLELQMETSVYQKHTVADMTIHGTLDTLECAIDPRQYATIRGVLSHNLGEDIAHLTVPTSPQTLTHSNVWTISSIHLELLNVVVRFEQEHDVSSLACVNFIRSRLLIETYSDTSQDIDLVSQEILVSDTRFQREPANKRSNVFTSIVQPISDSAHHSVQAELHARKRRDTSAYTILVNNMRLMAILDWWDAVNKFIMTPPEAAKTIVNNETRPRPTSYRRSPSDETQFELKLNITESQVVLVEDTSLWDTNAVILKSTTVISYRPGSEFKPVSCVLNHCEVFSCVIGMEEETALSIIDPVTVHLDLNAQNVLQIQVTTFCIRLSYHDMRMFAGIFKSIPAQARNAGCTEDVTPAANAYATSASVRRLTALGFSSEDCARALKVNRGRQDDAAIWLTKHARPVSKNVWPLTALQLNADCVTLCVIDDCLDSDVPLLEVSFTDLTVSQDLRDSPEPFKSPLLVETPKSPPLCLQTPDVEFAREALDRNPGPGGGKLKCLLSMDYYNRALSGWEPVVEPWRCEASWEYTLTSSLSRNRLQLELASREILNLNITSALIQLYKLVKTNWTQDYYSNTTKLELSPKNSPPGYRRRSPFVPFALNNQSGHKLWFTTIVTSPDGMECEEDPPTPDDGWWAVNAGATEPFSFGPRRPRGALRATPRLHALALRVQGWTPVELVCVDRVGTFFRLAMHQKTGIEARLVFDVTLEGSARKLVTVRSALQIVNDLPHNVEVKFDSQDQTFGENSWSRGAVVPSGSWVSAPLSVGACRAWLRPLPPSQRHPYMYCDRAIDWRDTTDCNHFCRSGDGRMYRFCCIIKREKFPPDRGQSMPGHTITLKPPLRLVNLLPVELQYCVEKSNPGNIPAGCTEPFHEVDVTNPVEVWFKLDGFTNSTILTIMPNLNSSFATKVKLVDTKGRRLYLNAYISIKKMDTIKVLISAPYWIINRTGVPLVFRQEGISSETAGQYEEHEIARMVAPLLFSFTHSEGSPTIIARVGKPGVVHQSEWCAPLGLGPGCAVRRVKSGNNQSLELGINIRPGRGRYRRTNMVIVAPRHHLHNNTSYVLQFAQSCFATTLSDPSATSTFVSAVAGCSLPFHWPRTDKDRLLCVRPLDTPNVMWSGAFPIDRDNSFHLSCRDASGSYFFIRVEVVLQGATFFVVLTDADTMPPPIRIKNMSPVSIAFHQVGNKEDCVVKQHSALSWVLPEPCGARVIALGAPGGSRIKLDLEQLGHTATLLYQNFIYIVFTQAGLHVSPASTSTQSNASTLEDGQLVFEVQPGSNKVILGRKRYGDRCQLWRRGPNNQLVHEGSSPPQATHEGGGEQVALTPHSMVLDIETPAPQPSTAAGLVIRRVDPRRVSTQSWRLLPPGRMGCAHSNLCVQPSGGLFGLRPGNRVVLGMMSMCRDGGVPIEQSVSWHTLRPGSGFLGLSLHARGPTKLLTIVDVKAPDKGWVDDDNDDANEFISDGSEFELKMRLGGLGVSLISRTEELLYSVFSGILLEASNSAQSRSFNLSVTDLQCDNQLLGTPVPVLTYALREGDALRMPALHMAADVTPSPPNRKYNALIFKHFIISMRPIAVKLEEKLMLKLCAWGGLGEEDDSNEDLDENDFETQRLLNEVTTVHAKRYYFGVLKIMPSQIRLSVQTASKLGNDLQKIKKHLNLTLIKFEDASVELEPYVRWHPFETAQFHVHSIIKHFKKELKWQAAKILGSVDFLGNPLGFMQDVSEGVSGLIYEGNVGALFKNVTHGLSNSAAKVTESLGDGLERMVVDEAHEETRRKIRSSGSHLAAGIRGLGLGLLGGATSLVKHSYEGFTQEGLPGLFAGVGKGLVGTVTKPVIGVLDLATETASALRESSRRSDKWIPEQLRPTRCCAGADGLLPRYSLTQAHGHHYLYSINGNDYSEAFLAYQCIRDTPHDIRALISDRFLRIFTCKGGTPQIIMETHLSALVQCGAVSAGRGAHYVELALRGGNALRRPRIACDSPELAAWLARNARYAKRIHRDRAHTLPNEEISDT